MKDFSQEPVGTRREPGFSAVADGDEAEILAAKERQNAELARSFAPQAAAAPKGLPGKEPPRTPASVWTKVFFLAAILALGAAACWYLVWPLGGAPAATTRADPDAMTSTERYRKTPLPPQPRNERETPAAAATPAADPAPADLLAEAAPPVASAPAGNDAADGKPKKKTLAERRLEAPLGFAGGAGVSAGSGRRPAPADAADTAYMRDDDNRLAAGLEPTPVPAAHAFVKRNLSLLLSKGTFVDCLLETAINTTVPGFTRCTIPRDVYSADGKVILLEKGSKITGEYRGAVQHGLARIFILWTEVETPRGVAVALNSPGADNLGRAGLGGYVDYHWWARFGNALMFSLVSDGFDFATARATDANGGVNYYQNTSDGMQEIIREAMRQSGNIPPTLTKNQGERIGIVVSRDVRFDRVYRLEAGRP